jgi:hypothetical protein
MSIYGGEIMDGNYKTAEKYKAVRESGKYS